MHIETGRSIYGGARQVLFILEGLQKIGVENLLVCDRGAEIASPAANFATVLETPISGDLDIGFIKRVRNHIREHNPDVVHIHSRRGADWLGGFAAKQERVPAVISRRVDNPETILTTKLKYRLFEQVIAISKGIGKVLLNQKLPAKKLSVVCSAVKTEAFNGPFDRAAFTQKFNLAQGTNSDQLYIGVIAQLIRRKGHGYLLESLTEIKEKYPNIKVLFFGRGPMENELQQQVNQLNLGDIVSIVGFHDDLPKWIGCLDLVVHPAEMEGLGVSLLQAGAASIPIIGTSVGGIPEILIDQQTGLLVEPKNIEQLSTAIDRLLGDKEMRIKLGKAARRHIEKVFSVDAMVKGNLAVYQTILGSQH